MKLDTFNKANDLSYVFVKCLLILLYTDKLLSQIIDDSHQQVKLGLSIIIAAHVHRGLVEL
jgi:hypothetical protein